MIASQQSSAYLIAQTISHPTLAHSQSHRLHRHFCCGNTIRLDPFWLRLTKCWNPKLPDWPWLIRTLTGAGCTPDTCATTLAAKAFVEARGRAKTFISLRTKIEPHFSSWNWPFWNSISISLSLLVDTWIRRDELTIHYRSCIWNTSLLSAAGYLFLIFPFPEMRSLHYLCGIWPCTSGQ